MRTYSLRAKDCGDIETFVRGLRGVRLEALHLQPHWPAKGPTHVDAQFDCDQSLDELLAQLAKLSNAQLMFDTLRAMPISGNPMTPDVRTPRQLITCAELEQMVRNAESIPATDGRVIPLSPRTVINLAKMASVAWREEEPEDLPLDELKRLTSTRDVEEDLGWGVFLAPDKAAKLVRMALRLHEQPN